MNFSRNAEAESALRKALTGQWFGQDVECYDTIDSTNIRARVLGGEPPAKAPHGALIVADRQISGRGRLNRSWDAEPGNALLMSVLLRPEGLKAENGAALIFVAALAVCDACRSIGADAAVKWPNDIVVSGRKVCGMLMETGLSGDAIDYAVMGIGVNVNGRPDPDAAPWAGCLRETVGRPLSRIEVLKPLARAYEAWYDVWARGGTDALMPAYEQRCVTLGRPVQVVAARETYTAAALALNGDGSLLVRREDGREETVRAGDVSVRGVMGYV